MTKLLMFISLLCLFCFAEVYPETVSSLDCYDSLFIQASAAPFNLQYLLAPAQKKIIAAGRDAMPFLVSRIGSPQPREYQALKDLFRKIEPKLAAEFIEPLIKNKNRATYASAAELLGIAGGKSIANLLYPDLEHDSVWVRLGAIRSLGDMKDTVAVSRLIRQAGHYDFRVRWYAAAALGKIGTPSALERLLDLTDDSLQIVKMTAYHFLKTGVNKLPDLQSRLNKQPKNLVLNKLNYLKNKSAYGDSTAFSKTDWLFIKGEF